MKYTANQENYFKQVVDGKFGKIAKLRVGREISKLEKAAEEYISKLEDEKEDLFRSNDITDEVLKKNFTNNHIKSIDKKIGTLQNLDENYFFNTAVDNIYKRDNKVDTYRGGAAFFGYERFGASAFVGLGTAITGQGMAIVAVSNLNSSLEKYVDSWERTIAKVSNTIDTSSLYFELDYAIGFTGVLIGACVSSAGMYQVVKGIYEERKAFQNIRNDEIKDLVGDRENQTESKEYETEFKYSKPIQTFNLDTKDWQDIDTTPTGIPPCSILHRKRYATKN